MGNKELDKVIRNSILFLYPVYGVLIGYLVSSHFVEISSTAGLRLIYGFGIIGAVLAVIALFRNMEE